MGGRAKYRRLNELYTEGTVVQLEEGIVMWLQVLNPFERQEVRKDAQTARARMVLAMQEEGTDEMLQAEAAFLEEGQERAVRKLVDLEMAQVMLKVVDGIRDDPEWKQKLEITDRSEDLLARDQTDPERRLLAKVNEEYLTEVGKRMQDERDELTARYSRYPEDELKATFRERYIDTLGSERAHAEFTLTELWLSARVCEATWDGERWDHSACGLHPERVYETKQEVRELPDALYELLTSELSAVNMAVREAKDSARQTSSSGSSPLPSEEAGSTASSQAEPRSDLPGPSQSPSTMPSMS